MYINRGSYFLLSKSVLVSGFVSRADCRRHPLLGFVAYKSSCLLLSFLTRSSDYLILQSPSRHLYRSFARTTIAIYLLISSRARCKSLMSHGTRTACCYQLYCPFAAISYPDMSRDFYISGSTLRAGCADLSLSLNDLSRLFSAVAEVSRWLVARSLSPITIMLWLKSSRSTFITHNTPHSTLLLSHSVLPRYLGTLSPLRHSS